MKNIYINPNPKQIHQFIIMAIPTRYSKHFNESLQKQQKIVTSCRSLKAEDICGVISSELFW